MIKMTAEELLKYATEHDNNCPTCIDCDDCPLGDNVIACKDIIGDCKDVIKNQDAKPAPFSESPCTSTACVDCAVSYRCLAEGEPLQFTPKKINLPSPCSSDLDCSECPDAWKCQMEGSHPKMKAEQVDHPQHYGGENNPYEAIKVIEANGWLENFCLGNVYKYCARSGKKNDKLEDLKKAAWYLNHLIKTLEETK